MHKALLLGLCGTLPALTTAQAEPAPLPALVVPAAQTPLPQLAADRFATDTAMADSVFTWAESNYSSYFSPANPPSQSASGYYFRAYANNVFLAEKDGILWVAIGGNTQQVGSLSDFAAKIGYKPATTVSMSVGQAAAYEFMRAIIQWQVDNSNYTTSMSSVSSGATGASYLDLFDIKVNSSVPMSSAGFVTLKCYHCHNWNLTYSQYSAFASALSKDGYYQGSLTYLQSGDLNGYMAYTQAQLAQYNSWVGQIPASYSTSWF